MIIKPRLIDFVLIDFIGMDLERLDFIFDIFVFGFLCAGVLRRLPSIGLAVKTCLTGTPTASGWRP